ncbi:hypothetical protein LCGC14_2649760, partial [marine sediment metagenome]
MTAKTFKLNEYLELRFENDETVIYLQGKPFIQCMRLVFQIPKERLDGYHYINSIDEAAEVKRAVLEDEGHVYQLNPEEEFWGHCSNLQVWIEHGYDTRLLHSNLSFPLLTHLMLAGDKKARRVFSEEIAKRCDDGYVPVILSLFESESFNYLSEEQFGYVMNSLKTLLRKDLELEKKFTLLCILFVEYLKHEDFTNSNEVYERLKSYYLPQRFSWVWSFAGGVYLGGSM